MITNNGATLTVDQFHAKENAMSHHNARLGVAGFGFAAGLTWAIGLLLMGWISWWSGWGAQMISVFSSVYIGYKPTFWGAIIGAIWGFVDFFIAGIILAAIYNRCCANKSESSNNNAG